MIYLAGMPRSGSTWAGSVIGKSALVRYYHEPFHPQRGIKGNPFKEFFQYIPVNSAAEDQEDLFEYIRNLQNYNVPGLYDVGDIRNSRKFRILYHPFSKYRSSILNQIPLIKDPPSIFISEWLVANFNVKIILVMRHPAAFVNSSRKVGWHYGFKTFLKQKELMNDYLEQFRDEMEFDVNNRPTNYSIENSILFWRVAQHIFNCYKSKYSNWYFIRHEDLLVNPVSEFEQIFNYLEISVDKHVKKFISESLGASQTEEISRLKRNSTMLIHEWRRGLSQKDIKLIKSSCQKESRMFYTDNDW